MKWICSDCGAVFDDDDADVSYEWIGEGVMGGYRPMETLCPECGSDCLEEAKECDNCGEWFDATDMIDVDGVKYCKECAQAVVDAFNAKWNKIKAS